MNTKSDLVDLATVLLYLGDLETSKVQAES